MIRELVVGLLVSALILGGVAAAGAETETVNADQAMDDLKAGNERYVKDKLTSPPNCGRERRRDTAQNGQKPKAVVLSCSDSRVPVEYIFDQGLGDLFVIRVAGNVAKTDETASVEYGADHLGSTLVVVLGHTKCGAVTAVVEGAELHDNLAALLGPIVPVVAQVKSQNLSLSVAQLLDKSVEGNIWQSVEGLFKRSPLLQSLVASGQIKIVGAKYDIESGLVAWMGEHPRQAELIRDAPGADH